ncbi:serine hydrolase domain-containing protein [Plantactinospora veratri]|uniref:Serine hydrolase domain-containing protein n=1 Tax=Plantactinospora veratri TaxID=1436122 RepID=A0ABU7SLE8_9ACTN
MITRRTLLRASAGAALTTTVGGTRAAPAAAVDADRSAAGPARQVDRPDLQAILDRAVSSGPISALVELRNADGVWRASSGSARFGAELPVPLNGRFRVGSVTKTFVATVVLQLVGQGRLRLDDTVERWLPGVIPGGAQITLRNLLQHTSGIYNFTNEILPHVIFPPESLVWERFRTYAPQELIAIANRHPAQFEPGTSWGYSNTNYILLSLVIERVTGHDYRQEVHRRILRPLRLHDTTLPGTYPYIRGPHAHGYVAMLRDGQYVPVDITAFNPSISAAAGEIISTTADLNTFYRALLGGRLLKPAQLQQMLADPIGPMAYGLGIYRLVLPCGTTLWGHDGSIPGYLTYAVSTDDATAQMSLSITPWLGDPTEPITTLVVQAMCGNQPPATTASGRSITITTVDGWLPTSRGL